MTNLSGSLSYRKDSNSFFINETGTNDGWVPLPISVNAKDLSSEDLRSLAERLGGGSKYQIYVDVDNPNASDSKDNNGISKLTPFKSIERALLEVARRSFRTPAQEQRLGVEGDIFERYTINLAPGEYTIQNTPGGFSSISNYSDYQIASNLIQRNRDWIVAESYAQTSGISGSTEATLLQDLSSWVIGLASDVSSLSNARAILDARDFLNPDKNIICTNPSAPPNNYFVGIYTSLSVRQQTVLALQELSARAINSAKNLGFITDPEITINPTDPAQILIYNKIAELSQVLIDTLQCTLDPRFSSVENFGLPSIFPESGEPPKEFYTMFNAASRAGVILPRGVSIVGVDLRKVKIRPAYVPDYTDALAERGAIFKMTGANFFSGFTVKDKVGLEKSHHMLTAFEFSSESELEEYYEKVRLAFTDKSIYHRSQDAANLLEKNLEWVSRKSIPSVVQASEINYATILEGEVFHIIKAIVSDLRALDKINIYNLGKRFHLTHILPISDPTEKSEAQVFYKASLDDAKLYIRDAINNEANPAEGGVVDESIIVDTSPGARCADVVSAIYSYIDILKNHIDGLYSGELAASYFIDSDVDPFVLESSIVVDYANDGLAIPSSAIDGVVGASPYIFSASLRSAYGMNGIDGDGSKVRGLKSYLAAQFTVISLQKDTAVFVPDSGEVGGFRYMGSKKTDPQDYRHFGYRVTNAAYSQLVSCFCICPAIHYWTDSGAEFSITNSTSNFGDISLYSEKYLPLSYPQDKGLKLVGVIKPKYIDYLANLDTSRVDNFILGNIESFDILVPGVDDRHPTEAKITLSTEARWLDTYNIANPNRTNKIYVASSLENQERSGRVKSVVTNNGKTEITIDTIVGSWPTVPQNVPIGGEDFDNTYDSVVLGRQTYIKRFVDPRSATDRQYRLILGRDLSLPGKRKPIVHYVLTQDGVDESLQPFNLNSSRQAFYIVRAPITELGSGAGTVGHELYDVKIGAVRINDLGNIEFETDLDFNSRLDLDYDPNDPELVDVLNKSTVSKTNIEAFLSLLGITGVNLSINSGSQVISLLSQGKLIKSNKPSIIRCGGQTWEYLGYYNYSTSIPFAQNQKVGENLSVSLQKLKRIEKTQTYLLGGRIYATGMDEEGNSYVGNTFQDLKTGETEEIIRGSSVEVLEALLNDQLASEVTFAGITIAGPDNTGGTLTITDGSDVNISGSNITISNSVLTFDNATTFENLPKATEDEFGVGRVATSDELKVEKTSGEEPAFVTPEGLRNWRVANKIVSQASTINIVYVSNDSSGKHTLTESTAPGAGDQVTYEEFKTHNDNAIAEDQWQLSDKTKDSFRCLSSMKEVARYIDDNLTTNDILTLNIDPGKYLANYTYNCALSISGSNGTGYSGWGNPDGTSTDNNGSGVIFYNSLRLDTLTNINPDAYSLVTGQFVINSENSSSIRYVHFWDWAETVKDPNTEFETDPRAMIKIKQVGDSSLEDVLERVNSYLYSTDPSNFPASNFNRFWGFAFGNSRNRPYINLKGFGDKSFDYCTFSGNCGIINHSLFTIDNNCRLRILGCVFRGNIETRISLKHVTKLDSNNIHLPNIDNSTKLGISSNFYTNNLLNSAYIDPYGLSGTSAEVCLTGFYEKVIFLSDGVSVFLQMGSNTFSTQTYLLGSATSGVNTISNLATSTPTMTINSDIKNAIRLEKYTTKLFGTEDDRLIDKSTTKLISGNTSIAYRGTDNLGNYIYNTPVPNIQVQNEFQSFLNTYKNQGPLIDKFFHLSYNSSIQYQAPYESIMPNRDTSDLVRSQGILGAFGRKAILTNSFGSYIGLNAETSVDTYSKSFDNTSNTVGISFSTGQQYHKNAFYPAWKGFNLGKYSYPVIIDCHLNQPVGYRDYSSFLTYLTTTVDSTIAYDYSKCLPYIEASGYDLDEVPPYTQFVLVWESSTQAISILYLGKSLDLNTPYFVPFGTITNIGLSQYFSAKSATPSRIYNTFDDVKTQAGSVLNGEHIYIKSFNLILTRRVTTGDTHQNINAWIPININNSQNWQNYAKPGESLIHHNLNQIGLVCSRYANGFSAEKLGYQMSTYDTSGISSFPTDLATLYSNLSYPTSIYPPGNNTESFKAYIAIGYNFFSTFSGVPMSVLSESSESYFANLYHGNLTI